MGNGAYSQDRSEDEDATDEQEHVGIDGATRTKESCEYIGWLLMELQSPIREAGDKICSNCSGFRRSRISRRSHVDF